MTREKPEQNSDADSSDEGRSIGVVGAALIGVGGMVGGGIFAVLGTAVGIADGGTPLAFAIAGVIALLSAYSYARLSVCFPSSGGTAIFLHKAFGVDKLTGTLNLILWLSYLVTIALYASAFGSYGVTFFDSPPPVVKHVIISAGIILPAVINLLNSAIVSKSETVIVIAKLLLLGVIIVAGVPHVEVSRIEPSTWASPLSLVVGGMVIFVAYEGFELIANAAEDVKQPAKSLPRAFFLCVLFVIALYIIISVVVVGSVSEKTIADAKDYALAEAARPSLGQAGFVLVSVSALLATFSAINATIYGNARLGFTLASSGELPQLVEKEVWHRPISGVVITAAIPLLLANLVEVEVIAFFASAGFLLIFAAVNAACFRLADDAKANRWVCALATLVCLAALTVLLIQTGRDNLPAVLGFTGLIVASLIFELIYSRISKRSFSFKRHGNSQH